MTRKMQIAGCLSLGVLPTVVVTVSVGVGKAAEIVAKPAERARAREIIDATSVAGGLIVHVGCGDGKLAAALGDGDSYLVHGLDADAAYIE